MGIKKERKQIMQELDRFKPHFHDVRDSVDGNRIQRTIHYPETAKVISKYFHGKHILEVGCGMGWITGYLQEMGENAEGFDVVQYAVDEGMRKGVAKNIFCADAMDTINWKKKWDVVFSINTIEYMEEDEVLIALQGLTKIFKEHLFLYLQTWFHFLFRSKGVPADFKFPVRDMYDGNRRTAQTRDWYVEQFDKLGVEEDYDLYKKIKFDDELISGSDFRDRSKCAGLGWKGLDGFMVLRHKKG